MGRKLNIGGVEPTDGWENFNIQEGESVDHVGDAADLSRFEDATFEAVYSSHTLEHWSYRDVPAVLQEWHRVLQPGGMLYVSVPDMAILAYLYLHPNITFPERIHLMRVIYGGHVDPYDYHRCGLDEVFLGAMLVSVGFEEPERVPDFEIFDDTSKLVLLGQLISVNMRARKPQETDGGVE